MSDDDRLRDSLLGRLRTGHAPEPPELETPAQQDARMRRTMWKLVALVVLVALPFVTGILLLPWLLPERRQDAGVLVFDFVKYAAIVVFLVPWVTKGSPFAITKETLLHDIGVAVWVMMAGIVLAYLILLLGSMAR
jgi:type VI protein secretion system component VasF